MTTNPCNVSESSRILTHRIIAEELVVLLTLGCGDVVALALDNLILFCAAFVKHKVHIAYPQCTLPLLFVS